MTDAEIRRAADRFCTRTDWLSSWHCFSYGQHYDPANVGFGPLVVSNHDVLAPGAGFDEHSHSGVDLVTWVVAGALRHTDSEGHSAVLGAGQLQVLQAGAGVVHSERNAGATEPVEYVQMWLRSEDPSVSYAGPVTAVSLPYGDLQVVELAAGDSYELGSGGLAHGYLVSGDLVAGPDRLASGDALRVRSGTIGLTAETHSKFLAWILRNG